MHVVTLILAAGTSSRMGRVKQLLSIHEKNTFTAHCRSFNEDKKY